MTAGGPPDRPPLRPRLRRPRSGRRASTVTVTVTRRSVTRRSLALQAQPGRLIAAAQARAAHWLGTPSQALRAVTVTRLAAAADDDAAATQAAAATGAGACRSPGPARGPGPASAGRGCVNVAPAAATVRWPGPLRSAVR